MLLVQRDQDSKRNSFVSHEKRNIETAFANKGTTNTTMNEMIGNDNTEVRNMERDNNPKSSLCTFYWNAFFQISRYSLGNLGLAEAFLVFNIAGFVVNF